MRKPFRISLLTGILFLAGALLTADTLIVNVQKTALRTEPKFYAQTVIVLGAGATVEKLGVLNGWVKVRTSGGYVGWLHSSAVSAKKFSLLAMDKSLKTEATADEVALAGKGFNKQVEDSYRAKHSGVNFFWVDKMLNIQVSPATMKQFLQAGNLGEFGGHK